jgi:hypothetical protein
VSPATESPGPDPIGRTLLQVRVPDAAAALEVDVLDPSPAAIAAVLAVPVDWGKCKTVRDFLVELLASLWSGARMAEDVGDWQKVARDAVGHAGLVPSWPAGAVAPPAEAHLDAGLLVHAAIKALSAPAPGGRP